MLSSKNIYRLLSTIALISLFAVHAIAAGTKQSSISPALENSTLENGELRISELVVPGQTESAPVNTQIRAENRLFAGGLDTKRVMEQKKGEAGAAAVKTKEEEVSTIALSSGRHDEYLRVVLEGPHEIISAGEVRQKDNVVSVTFSDAHFSLKENKLAVPFRRELNRILFTQFNLDKIRTHNLLKPSRLAIDFYIKKVVAVQKARAESPNMEQEKAEQKQEMRAGKHTPLSDVKIPVSFIVPDVSQGNNSNDPEEEVKQAEPEVFITISKKDVQKTVDKNVEEPVEKAAPHVTLPAQAGFMVSQMSEAKGTSGEPVEKLLDTPISNASGVTVLAGPSPEQKETGSDGSVTVETAAERSQGHSGTGLVADVIHETVPVEINDVMNNPALQSLPDVTASKLQIKEGTRKIALLTFDNLSNNNDALGTIMPLILARLEDRGYDVLGYEEVEAYLCERRIRQSSFLSGEVAKELGKDKMVHMLMGGSVLTFASEGNPKVGILARLIDISTGHIIWSDFVSLTGEDFTKVLGLGTVTSMDQLLPRALNRLFADIGNTSPIPAGKENYKIAVLPFKNQSKQRHAGTIITQLFQNELANNPMFDPVDFGDIKQTIVNLRIGHKGEVDYTNLQALSKSLGVDVVLTGTVEEYRAGKSYASPPSVTISARLLDSRRNRILWYDNIQLDGEENIIALDWGRLRSADKVAYGAVSGLVENMGAKGLLQ